MCDVCDGMSPREQLRRIKESIDEQGVAVYYVEDPELHRCFGYTIGLTPHHAKEFLIRGMGHEDTKMMLGGFADSVLKNGEFFDHGHSADWRDGRILHFNNMDGAENFARVAFELYGSATRVLEIHFAQPPKPREEVAMEYRNLAMTLADTRLLPRQPR
ncbi:DUF4262 domain-containing protein [Paeniglutamicibacter gangotriensis]|uniref:DUF4262 domain-containing protein n=1 Tax=Paeniglutamicibacter gangotriensis TaxID=254787 RepID=A0A5B0EBM4_9MICC|nr:DUF4262 domain-containing protein [Paeniglutamicibacter gangotriensis]KAA0976056.1 DUF4262 domain-containing protein [Paeniglutamicibacter gangotriensis]